MPPPPASASRRVDETDVERETRLAAEDVHARLELARRREVETSYWAHRGVGSARSLSTPMGAAEGPDADDVEALALSVGARAGVAPDVGRRIAAEVLEAERAAVLAAVGPPRATSTATAARRPPPALSSSVAAATLEARRDRTAAKAPSTRGDPARDGGDDDRFAFSPPRRAPDDRSFAPASPSDDAPAMTAALWRMAHTPPPTARRAALGYRADFDLAAFPPPGGDGGEEADDEAEAEAERRRASVSRAARETLERASGEAAAARAAVDAFDAATRDEDAARAERRLATTFSEASAEAAARGLARLFPRTRNTRSEEGEGSAARTLRSRPRDDPVPDVRGARANPPGGAGAAGIDRGKRPGPGGEPSDGAESFAAMLDEIASRPASPARPVFVELAAEGGGDAAAGGGFGERETPLGGGALAGGRAAAAKTSPPPPPPEHPWTAEDAEAVRAARAAARRAEDAMAAIVEEERLARAATESAVSNLLDARARLAAATARSVAEEAAAAAVFAAAEAASLKLAVREGEGKENAREEGAVSEALAGFLKVPLPVVPKTMG